jgi:hypothetical protein
MMRSRLYVFAMSLMLIMLTIAPASAIKVTAIILVKNVSPGEDISHKMTVDIGEANETVDVVAQLYGCGMALDGSRIQLPPEEDTSIYSARGFLKLTSEKVTVDPGAKKDIVLEGSVPHDVGAGGRYALVNIATVPTCDARIGVSSAVEVPIFLTINGSDLIETGIVKDINVSDGDEGLLVGVMFENTGNHHYKANAKAVLKDGEGTIIAESSVPSENSLIPTYTRLFAIKLDKAIDLSPGTYTIEASVVKEDGTILDSKETELEI